MKKTVDLLHRNLLFLKVFGIFIMMGVALLSCSDDGDDDILTFLDVHGNSQWKFQDPNSETTLYLIINDSEMSPFDLWLTFLDNSCYVHQSVEDDGTPEILENTKNKLKIKVAESSMEYTILTLSVSQNVLTVETEYYENGELDEENIVVLFANSDDISNIEICTF